MKPTPADAFRAAVEDGRLALEFGASREAASDQAALIELSDRVVIGPQTAARLLHALREALERRPMAAAGDASDLASATGSLDAPAGPGATPLNLPPEPAAEASAQLLDRVRALGVPYQYERSFRMSQDRLQANRFLTTVSRADLGEAALERTLDIGRSLGMPEAAQAALRARFDLAHALHFGFEAGDDAILCKIYVERRVPPDEVAEASARGAAVALHFAFKWNVDGGPHVESRYDWFPGLDAQGIASRLRTLYGGDGPSLDIALEALAVASERAGTTQLQYLEVDEPGTGRRSFDLNLYDAGLAVRDLLPVLLRMRDLYGIRPGQFQALFDQVRARALGHLAGGAHRGGRDFFNVYYGVTGFPLYADRLG